MDIIKTPTLFDLSNFAHASLFQGDVWEALLRIETYLNDFSHSIEVDIPDGCFLFNREMISIGKGTVIEPGSYIKGPCIIGNDCVIRSGAYVRPNVITGGNCIIGHSTEIKQAVMLDFACAAHFNYVGDSILGNRINLGAGSRLANVRFDRKEIILSIEDKNIPTGMYKLGAIIGDGAQVGCNAVLNPGTVMGKGSFCYPCSNIGGFIAPRSKE